MEAVDVPGRGVHHPHAVQMGEGALAAAQPAGQQLETGLNILQTLSFEEFDNFSFGRNQNCQFIQLISIHNHSNVCKILILPG